MYRSRIYITAALSLVASMSQPLSTVNNVSNSEGVDGLRLRLTSADSRPREHTDIPVNSAASDSKPRELTDTPVDNKGKPIETDKKTREPLTIEGILKRDIPLAEDLIDFTKIDQIDITNLVIDLNKLNNKSPKFVVYDSENLSRWLGNNSIDPLTRADIPKDGSYYFIKPREVVPDEPWWVKKENDQRVIDNSKLIEFIRESISPIRYGINVYKGFTKVDEYMHRLPHGYGEMTYDNGDVYRGYWDYHSRTKGKMTYKQDGSTFEGSFKNKKPNDKPHGNGTLTLANGIIFDGEWKDGIKNGKFTVSYLDGTSKSGTWDNNKLKFYDKTILFPYTHFNIDAPIRFEDSLSLTIRYDDLLKFQGTMTNKFEPVAGRMKCSSDAASVAYEVNKSNAIYIYKETADIEEPREGFSEGEKREVEAIKKRLSKNNPEKNVSDIREICAPVRLPFDDNLYLYGSLVHYKGYIVIDTHGYKMPDGDGIITYLNQELNHWNPQMSVYEGSLNMGRKTRGKMTYNLNGSKYGTYEGSFVEDRAYGEGRLTLANGIIFDGEWKDGIKNGKFTLTYLDGTSMKGTWDNNKLTFHDEKGKYKTIFFTYAGLEIDSPIPLSYDPKPTIEYYVNNTFLFSFDGSIDIKFEPVAGRVECFSDTDTLVAYEVNKSNGIYIYKETADIQEPRFGFTEDEEREVAAIKERLRQNNPQEYVGDISDICKQAKEANIKTARFVNRFNRT